MIELALVEYLANALWQIPLLAAGAWLLLAAARVEAKIEYRVWLAVLALAVLLPLHGMPAVRGAVPMRSQTVAEAQIWQAEARTQDISTPAVALQDEPRHAGAAALVPKLAPHGVAVSLTAARWMTGLYAGVVLFGLCRVAAAWRAARRLVENASEITLAGQHRVVLEDYGRRLRIRLPEVRESVEISIPMIVGAAMPVLLLPQDFAGHAVENIGTQVLAIQDIGVQDIRAALLHELAHVKRRDYLVNAVCQVAALPVVWHPAVHWVHSRLRRTREIACDRMAAGEMESSIGYARCLLSLANSVLAGPPRPNQAGGVGLFSNERSTNILEERIMRLTEAKMKLPVQARVVRAISGTAAMVAAAGVALMFHLTPVLASVETAPQSAGSAIAQASKAAPGVPPAAAPQAASAPAPATASTPSNTASAPEQGSVIEERTTKHGDSYTIVDGVRRPLTPEEKRRAEAAMAKARRAVAEAKAKLNSPEFKKQIAEAKAQATAEAMNSEEFRRALAEAQAEAAKAQDYVNSPEFKKQIADAKVQATTEAMNSEEFKRALAEAQAEAAKAQEFVNSPEFKEQIDQQIQAAVQQINSPKFHQQMEAAQKIDLTQMQHTMDEAMRKLNESLHRDLQSK